ncbi:MAG: putative glycerophosphodiester phosphodiesterase [Pedobacter sp.]|nr:putative glycerophosphodiester phosphodiesterase [Pedobacter sp.]
MRKNLMIMLLLLLFVNSSNAQTNTGIYLSQYQYSANTSKLALVKSQDGIELQKLTLSGPDAALFSIDKKNMLSIKPAARKANRPLQIELTAVTSSGSRKQQFTILKDAFIRNKVIAHRGAWKNTGATENSIASLNYALQIGCEGSEFDVHMSSDSVLFINHDPIIQGMKIEETPSATLKALKLANGETLPTLNQYLSEGMKQQKTRLVLEIKASVISKERGIALSHKVLDLVNEMHAEAWVDYISFDYEICKELIKLAPYAKVSYLNGDKSPAELAADHFYGLDYNLKVLQNHPSWIKEAKANNLHVNVWTVNEDQDMDFFLKEGADVITTNEPELLLKKLNK